MIYAWLWSFLYCFPFYQSSKNKKITFIGFICDKHLLKSFNLTWPMYWTTTKCSWRNIFKTLIEPKSLLRSYQASKKIHFRSYLDVNYISLSVDSKNSRNLIISHLSKSIEASKKSNKILEKGDRISQIFDVDAFKIGSQKIHGQNWIIPRNYKQHRMNPRNKNSYW